MVAFPNVKAGDVLIDSRWVYANGSRRWQTSRIMVIAITHSAGTALVSVDGGPPKLVTTRFFANLHREQAGI